MGSTHLSKNVIDLHGLTREGSLVVVRDALEERALQVDRESSILSLLVDSVYVDLHLRIYALLFVPLFSTCSRPTGRPFEDHHSAGQPLSGQCQRPWPFLTNTLKAEGWSVHKMDGGIVVNSQTIGP